jgi:hypothetical protein
MRAESMRAESMRAAGAGVEAMTELAPQTTRSPQGAPEGATAPPAPSADGAARARANRRPGPGMVFSGAIALFAVTFGFLTYQLRSGNDPSLGAQALASQPRPVLIRRVVKHRIITRVVPTAGASGTTVSTSAAPVTSSAAPVAAAPAPVTTGAS